MIKIADCIPSAAEMVRRTERGREVPPSAEAVEEMRAYLTERGYRDDNSEVFRSILCYGAAELEKKNRRGLFLTGPAGIGKTFGVSLLAARFGWPVYTAGQLEAAFLDPATTPVIFHDIIEGRYSLGYPHTIVIDDVGTESIPVVKFGTPHNLIADVLDHRYAQVFFRHGCRTLVTCNLTDAEFRARYGFRIDDRMNEVMTFAAVSGRSLR